MTGYLFSTKIRIIHLGTHYDYFPPKNPCLSDNLIENIKKETNSRFQIRKTDLTEASAKMRIWRGDRGTSSLLNSAFGFLLNFGWKPLPLYGCIVKWLCLSDKIQLSSSMH